MEKLKFSHNQRLKSTKDIKKLFSQGEIILSENFILKARLLIEKSEKYEIKFGVGVSKKAGNAVWRNRFKRLLRESFRLKQNELKLEKSLKILIMVTPFKCNKIKHPKLTLSTIDKDMYYLIKLIREKVDKL